VDVGPDKRQIVSGCRRAFTLVELLVVIAIIGVLVGLLLPAVQAARESARRTQCMNNLKQLGIACQLHVDARGFLPSGGWGDWWVGCPDQGAGKSQPGTWTYQLLPFIEESARAPLGQGDNCTAPGSRAAISQMVATPVSIFYCPSRRAPQGYPHGSRDIRNYDPPPVSAKTDYAGNLGGTFAVTGLGTDEGPPNLAAAATYSWKYSGAAFLTFWKKRYAAFDGMTGVIFQRSEVKLREITDGTSNTYLLGEKHLSPLHYEDGVPGNDDQSMYNGYDKDNLRAADVWDPLTGNKNDPPIRPPMPDAAADESAPTRFDWHFGGPHPTGWMALFCDGSVRYLGFEMSPDLHQNFATRNDGNITD
jgi:prepilin-type N-terminal cleavage/methylation domain-containing protein